MNSKLQFVAAAFVPTGQGFQLSFSGRDLPNTNPFNGPPDSYSHINVYYQPNPQTQYVLLGRTDQISNFRNPNWPEPFTSTYGGETGQRLKVELYDEDSPEADEFMSWIETTLWDIVHSGTINRDLIGLEQGYLIVKVMDDQKAS